MAVTGRAHRLILRLSKWTGYDIVHETEFQWELPVQFTDVHKEFEKPCNRVEMPFKFLNGDSFNCVTVGCVTQRHHFVSFLTWNTRNNRDFDHYKKYVLLLLVFMLIWNQNVLFGGKKTFKRNVSKVFHFFLKLNIVSLFHTWWSLQLFLPEFLSTKHEFSFYSLYKNNAVCLGFCLTG